MKEYITDNERNLIEIDDLQAAIYQVADYIHYLHSEYAPEMHRFDQKRQAYWRDISTKLNLLKIERSRDRITMK
ncbi:hypothetical protein HDC90_004600 [Pedobacter sp. AK013]|uniref:hypothetical protein n=1 Tax=Pedobacter sp. AK013 TaxID=2723071 RepID=UPI00160CFD67|nr:hypothetical protein [Pedobacter sp. AK013]MBB6239938.1 hypothetical protein [Pedobacter sp. AK013]